MLCKMVFRNSVLAAIVLICACFLFVFPAAAEPGPETEVPLEEAIGIARAVFSIPPEFEQFNSDYSRSDEEGAVWSLRWSGETPPGGYVEVNVSAENGEVLGFSFYKGTIPGTTYSGLPKYSREEALEMAKEWARKLQPERFAQTRLAPESGEYVPVRVLGTRDYPVTYDFRFQRLCEGIPVVDNGITIAVNGDTGELQRFNMTWKRDLKLPSAAGRVGIDQVRRVFNEDGMELVYVYTGSRERDTGERPYLVYAVRDGRFVVDALTGKVIDPDEGLYLLEADGLGGAGEARDQAMMKLTPAEAEVVEETRGLLSADAARRAAEAAYRLPGDAELKRSSLRQNWTVPGGRVWDFYYASEKEQSEVNLAVEARTGDLLRLSLYRTRDWQETPIVRFSEEQARQKAEAFMRKLKPEKAKDVILRSSRPELVWVAERDEPLPRAYSFNYVRLVNDIPYLDNGFSITVDSQTGEIINYTLNWWDTTFPQPEGILDKGTVCADYLEGNPLTLEYARVYSRWGHTKAPDYKLIYRLSDRADRMVDARSGQLLDREGNPVTERPKGFTDISGHPAEQDILLLLEAGIISGYGDRFRPDSPITNAELIAMLVEAHGDSRYYPPIPLKDGAPWYEQALERAVAMGIIESKDQYDPAAATSRLQAARMLVNAEGYGPLARLGSLFRLDAADAGLVPVSDRGYAASAVGLGLLPLKNGRFVPSDGLTRGEAAQILVRSLKG